VTPTKRRWRLPPNYYRRYLPTRCLGSRCSIDPSSSLNMQQAARSMPQGPSPKNTSDPSPTSSLAAYGCNRYTCTAFPLNGLPLSVTVFEPTGPSAHVAPVACPFR